MLIRLYDKTIFSLAKMRASDSRAPSSRVVRAAPNLTQIWVVSVGWGPFVVDRWAWLSAAADTHRRRTFECGWPLEMA
jgi:hypothetical protein